MVCKPNEPRDVVVLFMHGINTTCQDYYEPLRKLIVKELKRDRNSNVAGSVIFRAVFWADIVRGRQQEYMQYSREVGLLDPHSMHTLVLEGLGDAAAYQKTEQRRNSAYYDIQRRIQKALADAALPGTDNRPLIVVSHSLGCHIMSTFAWDLLKLKNHKIFQSDKPVTTPRPDSQTTPDYGPRDLDEGTQRFINNLEQMTAFERLDTFAGFVTMGNNMPLFTFVFGPQHVFPISHVPDTVECHPAFPGCAVEPIVKDHAKWINLYSLNDPLGYPLKPLNYAYFDEKRIEDVITKSEYHAPRNWTDWGVMFLSKRIGLREGFAKHAHTGYWHDPKVAKHAADLIRSVSTCDGSDIKQPDLFPDLNPTP